MTPSDNLSCIVDGLRKLRGEIVLSAAIDWALERCVVVIRVEGDEHEYSIDIRLPDFQGSYDAEMLDSMFTDGECANGVAAAIRAKFKEEILKELEETK